MATAKTMSKKSKRIDFGKSKAQVPYPTSSRSSSSRSREFFQMIPPEDRFNEACTRSSWRTSHHGHAQPVRAGVPRLLHRSPRYSIDECIERGLPYSVPLKAKLKLYCTDPEHEDFETIVQDVYWADPYMTPKGSFVIMGPSAWW